MHRFSLITTTQVEQNSPTIEPLNTFGPQLYSIEHIPDKGRGLVAGVNIVKGQRILREEPLFTCSVLWTSRKAFEKRLAEIIASLPPVKRDIFFSLHNVDQGSEHPLVTCFLTNCYPCDDNTEGAVYATICLLNHSCRANTHVAWNPQARLMTAHVIRDVKAGEELLANYVANMTHEVRKDKLKRLFDITCCCELCSSILLDIHLSDARRNKAQELFNAIGETKRMRTRPEDCLVECGRLMRLLEEEYAGCSEYLPGMSSVYDAAMGICFMHGDVASACIIQQRNYEARALFEGSDSLVMRQMKAAIENEHQETPMDTPMTKWSLKRADVPKLLKFMESALQKSKE